MIKDNIERIREDIALICRRLNRDPQEVVLVGVTKYAQSVGVIEALQNGVTHIAENKIQEAKEKFSAVDFSKYRLTRHMIGHLQTNKVKDALKLFDIIQTLDSERLADEINRQSQKLNRKTECLIQVNVAAEPQKFGVKTEELMKLVKHAVSLEDVRVSGLMAMAPMTEDDNVIRGTFRTLRELREKVKKEFQGCGNIAMTYLSMGMSHDYKIAIEEGSNMVRIGSAIFK